MHEIEKLKLGEMTCRDVLKDVARIIYSVHDDVKDKEFELELSWVCEESGWTHKQVARMLQQREIPRCSFFCAAKRLGPRLGTAFGAALERHRGGDTEP